MYFKEMNRNGPQGGVMHIKERKLYY